GGGRPDAEDRASRGGADKAPRESGGSAAGERGRAKTRRRARVAAPAETGVGGGVGGVFLASGMAGAELAGAVWRGGDAGVARVEPAAGAGVCALARGRRGGAQLVQADGVGGVL